MADQDKALATQLANIEARSGRSIEQLKAWVQASGLGKHGEIVARLKAELGMGHGDANLIAHLARQPAEPAAGDPLDALYVGAKAALRPIHEALLAGMQGLGVFEAAPKKSYISYRRKKQFAMIGPATNTRVELGLNIKSLDASPRLEALSAGQMCSFRVRLTEAAQVDDEVLGWVRAAYDAAG
jgi:hypothetical protein